MTSLTPGKARALTQASDERGIFTVFAIDHRDAMRMLLDPDDPSSVPAGLLTKVKLDFVIPQYRDFRVAGYVYSPDSGLFDDECPAVVWTEA